jgi:2-dehydro-3-deoxyphosphogluconate aldolase/(4S)-4-hydroxy-2-oxoglutarate aldolase
VSVIEELGRQRVLPVLRCADKDDTLATAHAAAAAGCRVVEVTMSTPGAEGAIGPLVADGMVVAVGTVRDARDVARLAAAGASLVVSFWNPPGGPGFLPALRPLLPDLQLLVTGGIGPDGVAPWLEAGALAVGLGSNLGTAATVGAAEVERRCRAALAAA